MLNVPVPPQYAVTGTVTKNGSTPPVTGCYPGYTRAELQFDHLADSRYSSSTTVGNCSAASDPFTISTSLYPGTYRVTVRRGSFGSASGLPSWDTVVSSNFVVSAASSGNVFDVPVPPQYAVTGIVTKNGSTPPVTGCYPGYTRAELQFDHLADARYSSTTTVGNCSSASDPFTVSTSLYPGTYRVTVRRGSFGSASGLPSWDTVVSSNFVVSAASSGNVFEVPVPPQYAVTGIVTKNGSTPPVTGCYPGYTRAELQFDHLADSRYSSTTTVGNCSSASDPFTVSTSLYPGTYRVTVRRGSFGSASGLPAWDTVVTSSFVVSAASSGNVFEVPVPPQYAVTGIVTKNGSTPPVTGCYPGYTRAELQFDHLADARYSSTTTVGNCTAASDPFTVSTSLYPGTYRVTVRRGSFGSASGLPSWDTVVSSNFVVSATSSGNVFEVPVPPQYAVSGIVTKNGATPAVTGCYPGYTRAELQFDHLADARYSSTATVGNCTAASDPFTVNTSLYPGTYRVTVRRGSFGSASGLPSWDTVVNSSFVVSAASSGNAFDVAVPPQYLVSGTVTKNGATPPVTGCYPGYTRAELQFDHLADARYSSSTTVGNCTSASDPFTFTTNLYPGTYRVTVRRGSFGSASGLPAWDTVVVDRLAIP